jgi:hypothetical protein
LSLLPDLSRREIRSKCLRHLRRTHHSSRCKVQPLWKDFPLKSTGSVVCLSNLIAVQSECQRLSTLPAGRSLPILHLAGKASTGRLWSHCAAQITAAAVGGPSMRPRKDSSP